MATKITKTIGSSGRDFTSLKTFAQWLASQALIAADAWVDALVYNDQGTSDTGFVYLQPATHDLTHYCVVRPADGLGVNDLNSTGALDYGTSGIQLTTSVGSGLAIGSGVSVQGFRVLVPAETAGTNNDSAIGMGTHNWDNPTSYICDFKYNRVNIQCGLAGDSNIVVLNPGNHATTTQISDNVFIHTANQGFCLKQDLNGSFERNTVVRRGTAVGFATIINSGYGGATVRDNVFINCSSAPVRLDVALGTCSNNFTNTAMTGDTTGYTVVTGTNALVQDESSDLRPTPNGPLIGAASAAAQTTSDIRGNNRGTEPDVGALQLNPATPLPLGEITSTIVDGQTITVSGTTTNSPTSGSASVAPASVPNGAQALGPTAVTLGDGTFTVSWNNVFPGNYQGASITFTNAGGTGPAAGGSSNMTILGISGSLMATIAASGVITLPSA